MVKYKAREYKKFLLIFLICLFLIIAYQIFVTKSGNEYINNLKEIVVIERVIPDFKKEVKVAFIGDQGLTADAKSVLSLIKNENTDLVMHLGDFDYRDDPEAWDKQITDILGDKFPYLAIIGNHDVPSWQGYEKKIKERLSKNPEIYCEGRIGVEASCRLGDVTFVISSPGITSYDHESLLKNYLQKSTTTWDICVWHKNQSAMQLGFKEDEVGWEVYEICRREGAIVATAHEHSYSRTYLLSSFINQTVDNTSNILKLEKGKSFAFVSGLGGQSIRPQEQKGDWWASVYTSSQNASPGALFCTFGIKQKDKAECYFKDINKKVIDEFSLIAPKITD